MKKLALAVHELRVETFETATAEEHAGTVLANAWTDVVRACRTDYPPGECFASNLETSCCDGTAVGQQSCGPYMETCHLGCTNQMTDYTCYTSPAATC